MLRTPFLRASFFAVCLVLSAPSAVLAAPDCAYWTQKDGVDGEAVKAFWKAATPDDVARCLKAGANPKARNEDGWSPLHRAAGSGNADTVTALLEAGANPKARGDKLFGFTPLHRAAISGNADTMTALLKAGADMEAWDKFLGLTPLHGAASSGNADTVTALLKAGADPKARDKNGERPIDLADKEGKLAGPAYWQLHDASFD